MKKSIIIILVLIMVLQTTFVQFTVSAGTEKNTFSFEGKEYTIDQILELDRETINRMFKKTTYDPAYVGFAGKDFEFLVSYRENYAFFNFFGLGEFLYSEKNRLSQSDAEKSKRADELLTELKEYFYSIHDFEDSIIHYDFFDTDFQFLTYYLSQTCYAPECVLSHLYGDFFTMYDKNFKEWRRNGNNKQKPGVCFDIEYCKLTKEVFLTDNQQNYSQYAIDLLFCGDEKKMCDGLMSPFCIDIEGTKYAPGELLAMNWKDLRRFDARYDGKITEIFRYVSSLPFIRHTYIRTVNGKTKDIAEGNYLVEDVLHDVLEYLNSSPATGDEDVTRAAVFSVSAVLALCALVPTFCSGRKRRKITE